MKQKKINNKIVINQNKYIIINNKVYKEVEPWNYIFYSINQRCNNSKATGYKSYGGRGIKNYLTKNDIKKLMLRDKYWFLKNPSIDRINNNGHYEFDNCRFIEKIENTIKNKRKIILQYSKNNKFIKEWISLADAARGLNISHSNISNCCNNKKSYLTTGGFKWKFK